MSHKFTCLLSFLCSGDEFENIGVYYNKIMYYMSTNQNLNTVKHFMDEGGKIREITKSKIPNLHLLAIRTSKIQGKLIKCLDLEFYNYFQK